MIDTLLCSVVDVSWLILTKREGLYSYVGLKAFPPLFLSSLFPFFPFFPFFPLFLFFSFFIMNGYKHEKNAKQAALGQAVLPQCIANYRLSVVAQLRATFDTLIRFHPSIRFTNINSRTQRNIHLIGDLENTEII